jgi:hypothetical protein
MVLFNHTACQILKLVSIYPLQKTSLDEGRPFGKRHDADAQAGRETLRISGSTRNGKSKSLRNAKEPLCDGHINIERAMEESNEAGRVTRRYWRNFKSGRRHEFNTPNLSED